MNAPEEDDDDHEGLPSDTGREETVRLIMEQLWEYGFGNSVKAVEQESRVRLESETATELKEAVIKGDYEAAHYLADSLITSSDPVLRKEQKAKAIFLI